MHSSRFMHIHSPMRLWRWIYRYLWCTSLRSLRTACILSWVIAPPRAAMRVPLLDGEKLGRCWLLQNVQRVKGCLCVLDHWRSSLMLLRGSYLWFSCFMLKSLYTHNSLMHHSMRVMLGPTNDALVQHWHLFQWVGCEKITGNPCVFSLNIGGSCKSVICLGSCDFPIQSCLNVATVTLHWEGKLPVPRCIRGRAWSSLTFPDDLHWRVVNMFRGQVPPSNVCTCIYMYVLYRIIMCVSVYTYIYIHIYTHAYTYTFNLHTCHQHPK